jgi:hypothetical protein
MRSSAQRQIPPLLVVVAAKILIYLRVSDRRGRVIFQQVLLGYIGRIFRFLVLGEKVVKRLILARSRFGGNGIVPFVCVVEFRIDVKNHATELKQAVFDDLSDSKFGRAHACHHI